MGIKIRMQGVTDDDITRAAKKNRMNEGDFILSLITQVAEAMDKPAKKSSEKTPPPKPKTGVDYVGMMKEYEKEMEIPTKQRRRGKRGGRRRKRHKHYNASYFNNK